MSYCENESYTKLKNKIIMKNAKYSINANLVYKNGYSGKNVNIAVLDTGVFKHKQLDGCIKHFMDFVGGKETCYDDNGHGTCVRYIISCRYRHGSGQDYMCLRCLIILAWDRRRIQFVHLSI